MYVGLALPLPLALFRPQTPLMLFLPQNPLLPVPIPPLGILTRSVTKQVRPHLRPRHRVRVRACAPHKLCDHFVQNFLPDLGRGDSDGVSRGAARELMRVFRPKVPQDPPESASESEAPRRRGDDIKRCQTFLWTFRTLYFALALQGQCKKRSAKCPHGNTCGTTTPPAPLPASSSWNGTLNPKP